MYEQPGASSEVMTLLLHALALSLARLEAEPRQRLLDDLQLHLAQMNVSTAESRARVEGYYQSLLVFVDQAVRWHS